ncbi:MAG TPA: NAD(P)-binding protein [Candidatus Dormibacteraeota bacterium]|nr:NAD(P)-binding protein [Candidatus Dormibacteraeota bacterium]
MTPGPLKYKTSDEVDFVIIGSGAAGGVFAKELSTNGFRVVVLEQGPYLKESDFVHDEVKVLQENLFTNHPELQPSTFRKTPEEKAKSQRVVTYGRCVGGRSVHFTANYWRFHEIDFVERSKVGAIPGTGFTDWPITYADLEPYYTKVEWEIGVSGLAGSSPFDPPRLKPYPMPPLPVKSSGVIFERAARKLGWHPFPHRWRFFRSPVPDAAHALTAAFAGASAARSAQSPALSPPSFVWPSAPAAARFGRIPTSIA